MSDRTGRLGPLGGLPRIVTNEERGRSGRFGNDGSGNERGKVGTRSREDVRVGGGGGSVIVETNTMEGAGQCGIEKEKHDSNFKQ